MGARGAMSRLWCVLAVIVFPRRFSERFRIASSRVRAIGLPRWQWRSSQFPFEGWPVVVQEDGPGR